MQVVIAMVLSK